MGELDVQIVTMDAMRVASAYGFGESPELQAWDKILAFAQAKGINVDEARFFGFNSPEPSPGSPNYGYEQWMTVGPDVEPQGDVRIVDFAGGPYAVTRFKGLSKIGQVWRQLVHWREDSPYQKGHHQWLEELLSPLDSSQEEWEFNLYLPIAE